MTIFLRKLRLKLFAQGSSVSRGWARIQTQNERVGKSFLVENKQTHTSHSVSWQREKVCWIETHLLKKNPADS